MPDQTRYWHSRGYVVTMGRLNRHHTPLTEAITERASLGSAEEWDGYKHGVLSALNDYIRREGGQ